MGPNDVELVRGSRLKGLATAEPAGIEVLPPHPHDLSAAPDFAWPHDAWSSELDCTDCGLRVLRMLLFGRRWVTRRVEKITFQDARAVSRMVSVDFSIPDEAPRLSDGRSTGILLPITMLRRKTLVDFSLRGEAGEAISLLGLRHTQALTRAMLTALAERVLDRAPLPEPVRSFIHDVVTGTQEQLEQRYLALDTSKEHHLVMELRSHPEFSVICDQIAHSFIAFILLPADSPARRIIKMHYDEPLTLHAKESGWNSKARRYQPVAEFLQPCSPDNLLSRLGLRPTTIRFPIPAAENTLSYHFEFNAPPDTQIVSATLLAGRHDLPNPSVDRVQGGLPVVDLHACEVPNGSISRVQVEVLPVRSGWLANAMLASAASTGILFFISMALHHRTLPQADTSAAFVVALVAGLVAMISKPAEHAMVSRLLAGLRLCAVLETVIMLGAAGRLALSSRPASAGVLAGLTAASALGTAYITYVWLRIWWASRSVVLSPWEQGPRLHQVYEHSSKERTRRYVSWEEARQDLGFHQPAIKVESAECDHYDIDGYARWTRDVDTALLRILRG